MEALPSAPPAKRQECVLPDGQNDALSQAIESICIKNLDHQPTICFLCLGNSRMPESKRTKNYGTPGLLTRHFVDIHVKPYPKDIRVQCSICKEQLESKLVLINHAERVHGTVSRRPLSALGPI
ncbi:hypothetical protein BDV06DRAFT_229530 [Aspergillus oleicola]